MVSRLGWGGGGHFGYQANWLFVHFSIFFPFFVLSLYIPYPVFLCLTIPLFFIWSGRWMQRASGILGGRMDLLWLFLRDVFYLVASLLLCSNFKITFLVES